MYQKVSLQKKWIELIRLSESTQPKEIIQHIHCISTYKQRIIGKWNKDNATYNSVKQHEILKNTKVTKFISKILRKTKFTKIHTRLLHHKLYAYGSENSLLLRCQLFSNCSMDSTQYQAIS